MFIVSRNIISTWLALHWRTVRGPLPPVAIGLLSKKRNKVYNKSDYSLKLLLGIDRLSGQVFSILGVSVGGFPVRLTLKQTNSKCATLNLMQHLFPKTLSDWSYITINSLLTMKQS